MILTCPACDTKYVVKDGAIPAGGRQVRCASCKHSWHQDPEEPAILETSEAAIVDFGGPPPPAPDHEPVEVADVPEQAEAEALVSDYPEPEVDAASYDLPEPSQAEPPSTTHDAPIEGDYRAPFPEEPDRPEEWQNPNHRDDEFVGYAPIADDDEPGRSRWPILVGLLILIVAAAAAFWFLAPEAWRTRAGIAGVGTTPLQLMITTSDRQPLESGNELVAISGRVINPTDQAQNVPPIRAELRDRQTKAVVHRWTIAPPASVLAPRSSASFNSAEVDVPKGGDELTVTLGS